MLPAPIFSEFDMRVPGPGAPLRIPPRHGFTVAERRPIGPNRGQKLQAAAKNPQLSRPKSPKNKLQNPTSPLPSLADATSPEELYLSMDALPGELLPNPSRPSGGNVYQVGGVPVEFPYKPYGTQLAFMGRVIATLDRARRHGRSHALLESPTGTGKSLSLLCSALAWQRHFPLRPQPAAAAAPDPLLHGGGFLPDTQPSPPPPPGSGEKASPAAGVGGKALKKQPVPTIYYASRTHSQISQVIREYRKTPYRVPMAILASRKRYCTNKYVCMSENVDEQCKLLLDDKIQGCPEFKNAHKVKAHPSVQSGGHYEVHDIEDLVNVGRTVKGCAYFAAQALAEEAQLVFCPYNYIISPIVRRAMDIDIRGRIIILDEAHNIEDIARDAGSVDVDEELLSSLQTELGQLCTNDGVAMIYQPLHDIIQGLISWIADRKDNLQKHEFEHHSSYWTGERAARELQHAGITPQCFPILQECATKAVRAASDAESDGAHLSGGAAMTLESLFSSLSYFFAGNGCHSSDYQLALQRYVKREDQNAADGWKCTMSLWCLSPAVVFQEIADMSLSVILTSGTLSPMGSFTSELGVQFEACMEAPHVINVENQVFATVISSGPTKHPLNASYKTADAYAFQDELGASLEEICRIVPGGALVFFPSYKLLDKLQKRWSQTGQWTRLNAQKPLFVEPRSGEELEPVLKGYYDAVLGKTRASPKKKRGGSKKIVKNRVTKNSSEESVKTGAAFLAVCRGKVSEGIDFSDDNARVVVIVGIPFPNINDVQVNLKKRYNDVYKSSKGLLSGSEWYCHQAFRALNQAAGRCIRHRFDYGGIILMDERYREERNVAYISKWLRNSIKQYDSFQGTMDELRYFFQNAEVQIKIETKDVSIKDGLDADILECHSDKIKLPSSEPSFSDQTMPLKNQKVKIGHHNGRARNIDTVAKIGPKQSGKSHVSSALKKVSSKSSASAIKQNLLESQIPSGGQLQPPSSSVLSHVNDEADIGVRYEIEESCINLVDLEEPDAQPRYAKITIMKPLENNLQPLVGQTHMECPVTSSSDHSEDGNSSAKVVDDCDQVVETPLLFSATNGNMSSCMSTLEATPERLANRVCGPEHDSLLNRSVNSQNQKRRKLSTPLRSCTHVRRFSSAGQSFCQADCAMSTVSADLKGTVGLPCTGSSARSKHGTVNGKFLERDHDMIGLSSKGCSQKKLSICCFNCKSPLGLPEEGFIVTCSLSSFSKIYLAYVQKHGPRVVFRPDDEVLTAPSTKVHTVVCDISSVILCRCSSEDAVYPGVWSEKDGCVFRAVNCPFCAAEDSCLGVQVLATDASNGHLLNKVLLFADCLDVKHDPSKEQVPMNCSELNDHHSPVIDLDSYACKRPSEDMAPLNSMRSLVSKLSLPKRGSSTTDRRYGGCT